MVRRGGVEPPRLAPQASETCVSANSTISAQINRLVYLKTLGLSRVDSSSESWYNIARMTDKIVASNRQARFEYDILETFEAGIVLKGTEVKSLRTGKASLSNSYARIEGSELFLQGMHIAPYEFGNIANPDPIRPRKLLLHKKQIMKLIGEVTIKKLTIVPLKAYFKEGIIKVEIALVKGKKLYDKRVAVKKRESDRELKRILRSRS